MKARTLIHVSARISAYQRVYHERSDTLIHTLIRADTCISAWYADTRISAYQRVSARISDMYQNADTYQWDMMRLQDGAYVSGVYQRVKKHPS